MTTENEKELFTLLDEFCDPNAQLSIKKLHRIDFLLRSKRGDECVTQLMQQGWKEESEDFGKENYERIFARVKQHIEASQSKRLSFMQFFYRCAAVLLLPLLGLSAYFIVQAINSDRHIHTEIVKIVELQETQSRITLADGSTVTLKDGSRLIKKNNFSGNTREIALEGEAFFDIAHNPDMPFIIHTGNVRTTVLGTAFSIKAVPSETSITVTVVEGKVRVEDGSRLLAILGADQQFIHGIESEHLQEMAVEEAVEEEVNRISHELIFSNMPFGDIVQYLAVRHGVSIVIKNEELKQQRIHVLLDNRNSIDALLKLLCASQHATFTIEEGTYVIRSMR
ncbi:MAG: FecR domain-containing protein [Bacteroidales bacterium]|nr:FecR domain-containing protein [Bacteroidales bacterium]